MSKHTIEEVAQTLDEHFSYGSLVTNPLTVNQVTKHNIVARLLYNCTLDELEIIEREVKASKKNYIEI